MVDEDSHSTQPPWGQGWHSTDLSVSGEEGHSTILLAHYIFWFKLRAKLFSNASDAEKLHKLKCMEILILLYNLHI